MLYDYKCNDCGEEMIDVKQSIHDDALVFCEHCNSDGLERVIHVAGGFRIGGTGVHKPTAHLIVNTKLGRK